MSLSKNHTISKIIAKAIVRITIILIALPIILYFTKPEAMAQSLSFTTSIAIIAPVLLLLCFVILLVFVLKHKYNKMEYNWLLVLTGFFVCAYLILFYTRILLIFQ